MELNDKEFDAAFRKKVFDADPQFEEAAWDKMEQKLRRRDRLVIFRYSAVACLVLAGAIVGLYTISDREPMSSAKMGVAVQSDAHRSKGVTSGKLPAGDLNEESERKLPLKSYSGVYQRKIVKDSIPEKNKELSSAVATKIVATATISVPEVESNDVQLADAEALGAIAPAEGQKISVDEKQTKSNRVVPMNLSISAGPEFNSASSLIGGDPGFNVGLAFGLGVTKRLSLQTGIHYSMKEYHAGNYAYKLGNERVQNLITDVEASCAVLEIPLLVSYQISDNYKRSIALNAGISSYFMLKEDYVFKYTAESGFEDRYAEKRNVNQHYLSVVNLSATYFVKLKKEQLQLGFEPFMKIPLKGVGEGKVNLKSSGVSLKLRYDINKKNN